MKNLASRLFIRLLRTVIFSATIMCLISCQSAPSKPVLALYNGIDPAGAAAEILTVLRLHNIPVVFAEKPLSTIPGFTVIETGWKSSDSLADLALDVVGGTTTQLKYRIQVYENEYTIEAVSRILPGSQHFSSNTDFNANGKTLTPVQPHSLSWETLTELNKKIESGLSVLLPSRILY